LIEKEDGMTKYKYGNPEAPIVLIQPVGDHDLPEIEGEVAQIRKLTALDFQMIAVKVDDWNLDLSYTDELMRSRYSVFGPRPRTPSCMQRSYLLSIDFKVTSLTDWAAQLKINPLYAILSGFEVGDTPGVSSLTIKFQSIKIIPTL